jgi:Ca-activated chloride channel family protein
MFMGWLRLRALGIAVLSLSLPFFLTACGGGDGTQKSAPRFAVTSTEVRYEPLDRVAPPAPNAKDVSYFNGGPTPEEKRAAPGPRHNTEAYDRIHDNSFFAVRQNPLSTFSIDVDTASYSNVRRFLNQGQLPPKDAVRIEELVNYFHYNYPQPKDEHPVSINADVTACPWNSEHRLVRIALQAKRIDAEELPPRNLVFLIDVSGSMKPENRLPLVKKALGLLVEQLKGSDRVSIVIYAGESGLLLPSTAGNQKQRIVQAINNLGAGGSTNGAGGIVQAYQVAQESFIENGANRVILCTDGDFNVGVTNQGDLTRLIEDKKKSGIFLTVLGFGMGNLKDSTLEKLADKGNGHYAYIDTLDEARKVFVENGAALVLAAKDVKLQIEFNPAKAAAYRLIGYENRLLRAQEFNDDQISAGAMGAGHTVTALYEVVPFGKKVNVPGVDPLKYQQPAGEAPAADSAELLTVKLRYKDPKAETSKLLSRTLEDKGAALEQAPRDLRFAAGVAAFGMLLRESQYRGTATYALVRQLAQEGQGDDQPGERGEFLKLTALAERLQSR